MAAKRLFRHHTSDIQQPGRCDGRPSDLMPIERDLLGRSGLTPLPKSSRYQSKPTTRTTPLAKRVGSADVVARLERAKRSSKRSSTGRTTPPQAPSTSSGSPAREELERRPLPTQSRKRSRTSLGTASQSLVGASFAPATLPIREMFAQSSVPSFTS